MNGKVKWFNAKNHFGFIEGEDGKDYFVHMTALKPGTKLFENDEVTFDPVEGERGLQAQNVSKTEEGSATESAPTEVTDTPEEEVAETEVVEDSKDEETLEKVEEPVQEETETQEEPEKTETKTEEKKEAA